MQVVGFNFIKIQAHKEKGFKEGAITTDIQFVDITKQTSALLPDQELLCVSFLFSIIYTQKKDKKDVTQGEINIQGNLMLAAPKDKAEEVLKAYKKKELSAQIKIPLFNIILKKCSLKALQLEEDLSLPSHMPLPKIEAKPSPKA